MKRHPKPKPPVPGRSIENRMTTEKSRKLIAQIRKDPDFRPGDVDDDYLMALMRVAEQRQMSTRELSRYEQAMIDTTPILASPQLEAGTGDLRLILPMAEMQDFLKAWEGVKGSRGFAANYDGSKLVMLVNSMASSSAYLDDARADTKQDTELLVLGQTLKRLAENRAQPSLPGIGATPTPLKVPGYTQLCDHLPKLAPSGIIEALRTRIEMFKQLRALDGLEGRERICTTLLIDGTDVPAWAPQKPAPKDDPDRERALRGRCPEAGYRMYTRGTGPGGKRDVEPTDDPMKILEKGKDWRGYHLVTLLDQATGLPLIHFLMDSSLDEAPAIIPMLKLLFEEWPECPVERIVGDSAWDEDWANRLCEVNYGIHPIFRLSEGRNPRYKFKEGASRDGTIAGITHDGQLLCSAHNKPLAYETLQRPPRTFKEDSKPDLEPGDATKPDAFRVRVSGKCGCTGSTTFACKNDWSRLTFYPHHHNGRPDLYAERVAWIDRLNGIESFHNRLKSRGLATRGTDRMRITDKDAVQCLIELASLSMVAAVLYDQRDLHGHCPVSLAVPESGAVKPGEGIGLDAMADAA